MIEGSLVRIVASLLVSLRFQTFSQALPHEIQKRREFLLLIFVDPLMLKISHGRTADDFL